MKNFIAVISILLILAGCRKDVETHSTETNGSEYVPPTVTINGSVAGAVTDEQGLPAAGITVVSGDHITTTDDHGFFMFRDIPLDVAGAFIKVEHPQYWHASRNVYPRHNAMHYTHLTLMDKMVRGQFSAAEGGEAALSEDVSLQFEPGAVVDESGAPYSGDVIVHARTLPSDPPGSAAMMPGSMRGIDKDNKSRALRSFGMAAVEISSPSGQPLQPATDVPARLSFLLSSETAGQAPAQSKLMYFDEASGYWREAGTAVREGNHYIAEVEHFSWWGFFDEYEEVELSGAVVSESGAPTAGVAVNILGPNGIINSIFTDTDGNFLSGVPAGLPLNIQVLNACNTTIFSNDIGALSADTDLGEIEVVEQDFTAVTLSGNIVNCDGEAVAANNVIVCYDQGCDQIPVESGGAFGQTFGVCGNPELTIFFFDPATGEALTLTEPSASEIDLGEVELCDSPAETFISLTVQGNTTFYPFPQYLTTLQGTHRVRAQDSQYNISVTWPVPETGTFTNEQVEFKYLEYIQESGQLQGFQAGCFTNECENFTVTITEFGAAGGGFVEGTYEGVLDYTAGFEGIFPNTVITGSFKVPI